MLGAFGLNEAMVRWLNDLAQQGIFTTDVDLVIRGWNRWLEMNSGLTSGAVVGLPLFEVFPELVQRGFDDFYRQAAQGHVQVLSQRFHRCLIRMPVPLGLPFSEMQQSARIAPLYREGKIVGTVTVIDDVTERVAREADLRVAKDAAEQANQAKDEFLATLAHELRTPLNNILGWMHILRTRPPDQSLLEKALNSIEQNTVMQTRLVEDLVDIARIAAGKIAIENVEVDLGSTIRSTLESILQSCELKGINFETSGIDDLVTVAGDSKRIQQILSNLLNNAVKFTAAGGSIFVELRTSRHHAEIRVKDTGVGIKPEFLPHIFERFQQADHPKDTNQGLGLGLDIVKRLVELHGGAIRAHSEGEGRGTMFTVRLPLLKSTENATQTT